MIFFRPENTKKKLFLHVGMDKTGTSAIQSFLYRNREGLLSKAGIIYPKTGIWNDFSHHPVAFSCLQINDYTLADLDSYCKQMIKEIKDTDTVLLSSECLFKAPLKESFNQFYEFITGNFSEIKVIVYLRRQDEWVISRHKHSVISGNELPIDMLERPFFCDYKQYLDKWGNLFGKENVVVRPYEKQQFHGGSIFSDFLSLLNIDMTDDFIMPERTVNTALNNNEYSFKRLCNILGFNKGGVDKLNTILIEHSICREHPTNHYDLISNRKKIEIIERYSKINADIAAEYLPERKVQLFYEKTPDPAQSNNVFSNIDDVTILEIMSFIESKHPRTNSKIHRLCEKALASSDEQAQVAATKLMAGTRGTI